MTYRIRLSPHAQRDLDHLHGELYLRVEAAIDRLTENPRPAGCLKMVGREGQWRIRVGSYRIVYSIDDSERTVSIQEVGHRRSVYRF